MGFQPITKMNKRGFEIKSAIFAMIAISFIVIAVGYIVQDWNSYYGTGTSTLQGGDLGEYNTAGSLRVGAEDNKGRIAPQGSAGGEDSESLTYRGVFGIITGLYTTFNIVTPIIELTSDRFGLPIEVVSTILIFISVAITFTIVAIVFRRARA